jgi:PIN domain nuclease of toxin-antitoxin system
MSLLVDTHVFLWFESESAKLAPEIRDVLIGHQDRVYISAASFWEIAIKRQSGKLILSGSPRAAARAAGFVELPIDSADAETAGTLNWDHRDPFDRILVAHCLNHAMTLVTADDKIRAHPNLSVIWVG